jgi:isopenicillin N synthase-like dioxygenase
MSSSSSSSSSSSPSSSSDNDFSDWCGWHNDHGSLTGLVPAIYTNKDDEVVPCPDPEAGLYIRSRKGDLVKVVLPKGSEGRNCISFQIGETAQIHTGGTLQATPHAVRGAGGEAGRGISRQTFAVFMEPEYDGDMEVPEGIGVEQVQDSEAAKHLPTSVRTLASRWKKGQDFGQFSDATFSAFY